jgi:tetratricopeptide (TPR) repeat protein
MIRQRIKAGLKRAVAQGTRLDGPRSTLPWSRYADAEPLYRRSLAIQEKALGPNHPDVANSLNNLALLYQTKARYADAESLLNRSLAIGENVFGPDNPGVATSQSNLANLYVFQARYADAETLYKRALAIREKVLGPSHPEVAYALNNLANLYQTQSRLADAEPLLLRSLAIGEKGACQFSQSHVRGAGEEIHCDLGSSGRQRSGDGCPAGRLAQRDRAGGRPEIRLPVVEIDSAGQHRGAAAARTDSVGIR